MGFLLTLSFLATVRGVVTQDLVIEPPASVHTKAGTNVTFTCRLQPVGSHQHITSCRWVFVDCSTQRSLIFGGQNQTNVTQEMDSELPAPEVFILENGTACRLWLPAVCPRDAGRYFCADLETGILSDAAVLELRIAPGPESGPGGHGTSASCPHDKDDGVDNNSSRGDYKEQHRNHLTVIAAVVGTILVLLNVSLGGAACYYRRLVWRINREDSKLDLDLIRMQSQAAVLQKETELLANGPSPDGQEERYLPS
ncbi:uncharacterized protein LOC119725134 [Patiria miniata]|uniref:Ig-like domain-containing protein n=1 Tax=Patiria miniata TaxID=46514 RepID=A0A913ZKU5_PATMI|nr:uncharacterized protein LOC119725134 [Patiria miniata]